MFGFALARRAAMNSALHGDGEMKTIFACDLSPMKFRICVSPSYWNLGSVSGFA